MATSEIRITNPDWVAEAVDFTRLYPDDDARVRVAITLARVLVAKPLLDLGLHLAQG